MAWYSRFFPQKKKTVTVIKPTKASVVVTDYKGGTSKTTSIVTSGTTGQTSRTVRRSGGSTTYTPTNQFADPVRQQSVMPDPITQAAQRTSARTSGITVAQQQAAVTRQQQSQEPSRISRAKTSTLDFVTAGGTTARRLNVKQAELNRDVTRFNVRYNERQLERKEYQEALRKQRALQREQTAIETEKERKVGSLSYRVSAQIFGTLGKGALNPSLDDTGKPIRLYTGTVPITPIGVTSLFGGTKSLGFIGAQRTIKGATVTEIIYSSGKRVGTAVGITQKQGQIFKTVTAGKSGRVGYSLAAQQPKVSRVQSFVGRGLSKQKSLLYGETPLIRTTSFAETASVKGHKLIRTAIKFPSGKLVPKKVFTIKDLSKAESLSFQTDRVALVAGKSRAIKGGAVDFKGLIFKKAPTLSTGKGFTSMGKGGFTTTQQKGYSDVLASVTQSLPAQTGVVRPATSFVSARAITTQSTQQPPKLTSVSLLKPALKEQTKVKTTTVTIPRFKSLTKQMPKQISKTRTLSKTITKSVTAQAVKQSPALIQTQGVMQQQAQKQVPLLRQVSVFTTPTPITNIRPFPFVRFKLSKGKGVTPKRSRIPVFLRRFGKFKIIGYGRTQKEAVGIGRSAASKTLGATFKVPTYKGKKIKGFRTKKTKEGVEFIELPKFRLSTGTEKKEIKYFKQLKGGKKKKKNGK